MSTEEITIQPGRTMSNARELSQVPSATLSFKNRIINGAMMIDQRNAGASVTITTDPQYTVDRWKIGVSQASRVSVQRSTVAPAGFTNSVLITSLAATTVGASDYFGFQQDIEGLNAADLGWGTANAQPVTVSFQVRSSVTGSYSAAIRNSAQNRAYPFSYTINAANTWETKTVTIPGDTSGTWLTDNGVGLRLSFSLGTGSNFSGTAGAWVGSNTPAVTGAVNFVSTNGATFYITGVQLEKGSTATSFDYRPYGTELALCQRYYEKSYEIETVPGTAIGNNAAGSVALHNATGGSGPMGLSHYMKVSKRTPPTVTVYSSSSGASGFWDSAGTPNAVTISTVGSNQFFVYGNGNNNYMAWTASSEL